MTINVLMFLLESVAGILANSTALFADSVDMLGDAIVYGLAYMPSAGVSSGRPAPRFSRV